MKEQLARILTKTVVDQGIRRKDSFSYYYPASIFKPTDKEARDGKMTLAFENSNSNNIVASFSLIMEASADLDVDTGAVSTYYNGVEYDAVSLPQGSEGSVRYYFTDMTDYSRNEHIKKRSRNSEVIEVGVVLAGNLRDYYAEEELASWIKSLDNLVTEEYRIILEEGIITTSGLEGRKYFHYTGTEWSERKGQ